MKTKKIRKYLTKIREVYPLVYVQFHSDGSGSIDHLSNVNLAIKEVVEFDNEKEMKRALKRLANGS